MHSLTPSWVSSVKSMPFDNGTILIELMPASTDWLLLSVAIVGERVRTKQQLSNAAQQHTMGCVHEGHNTWRKTDSRRGGTPKALRAKRHTFRHTLTQPLTVTPSHLNSPPHLSKRRNSLACRIGRHTTFDQVFATSIGIKCPHVGARPTPLTLFIDNNEGNKLSKIVASRVVSQSKSPIRE